MATLDELIGSWALSLRAANRAARTVAQYVDESLAQFRRRGVFFLADRALATVLAVALAVTTAVAALGMEATFRQSQQQTAAASMPSLARACAIDVAVTTVRVTGTEPGSDRTWEAR